MYYKCNIVIDAITYEVTNDLKNWDDFDLSFKRNSYDGVIRSFSTKFEFVNRAYLLLKNEYAKKYLSCAASVVFYNRNNSWSWDEVFRCSLDFSTYSEDGNTVSINAVDDTLSSIVKAKKGIEYEYPVSDLNTNNLKYDGLEFQYEAKYILGAMSYESDGVQYINVKTVGIGQTYSLPVYLLENSELPSLDSKLLFNNVPEETGVTLATTKPFMSALNDTHVDLNFTTEYYAKNIRGEVTKIRFVIAIKNTDGSTREIWSTEGDGFYRYINISIPIDLTAGQTVCLYMLVAFKSIAIIENRAEIVLPRFSLSINFVSRINAVDMNVIPLTEVLKKLIESMTGETKYQSSIDGYLPLSKTDRLSSTYISAAESIRGIPEAKLYTSFSKFTEFMEAVFGYVPKIEGTSIKFIHRSKLFSNEIAKDLGDQTSGYSYSVNPSLIYSSVKSGYDKQDYDSINGRDEFRFTNEFETGLTLTNNVLSLISPYRADAYGIEFLAQKRGANTTDNSSDKNVFIISCVPGDLAMSYLKVNRPFPHNLITGVISPITMFNLEYSPRYMLEANKLFIGSCAGKLKFTSSNGNSDVSINGVREDSDLIIENRLFTVGEVQIDAGDMSIPDNLDGIVTLKNKGEIVSGYIKQAKFGAGIDETVKYTLIVKEIKTE